MIKKVLANKSSFKSVEFKPGFNVVWADRTKESTKKDSRNGLGKSLLIEIIHFCLGAKASYGKGLLVEPLKGWEFSLVLQLGDEDVTITRAVDRPSVVTVDGDTSSWPIHGEAQKGRLTYGIKEWNILLGHLLLGLTLRDRERKYQPTFHSLISYCIRRGKDAFSTPFEHYRKQMEWDKQVNNAFLLGLSWEDASDLQDLKDREKGLQDFRNAAKTGVVKEFIGSLGDLEAQKIRLKAESEHEASALKSFKVLPQYEKVQTEANALTKAIHELVDANTMDRRLVDLYEKNLKEERPPVDESVERLYQEAGISLPGVALRRLEEVREFHKSIVENRRAFLASEIDRLKREIVKRDRLVRRKTDKRALVMEVLRTHGALEEHMLLQTRHMDTINRLNSISTMIENLKTFESSLSDVKIAKEELQKKARRDYEERGIIRERAISLFNEYSERLYNAPGKLVIDVRPTGLRFDVEIERSGSSGISNMKVFCYDLMLARLWAQRRPSPKMCVHDSIIYDGVDERQRALALEIAAAESHRHNFQYICTLNSDYVPWAEFSKEFDLRKHIRLRLTDESPEGCLLGIRF
ncbi:MAG: ABC-three component system protein [Desulfomonilaceae bacterium]